MTIAAVRRSTVTAWLLPILWLALTLALVQVLRTLPLDRAVAELQRVKPMWLVLALAVNFAILPLWALEWRILVPGTARILYARMFEVVAVTASVLNSVPFLAGEASAVALLIARAGLSRGAALSVLAMDQLLVAFAKLSVLSLAVAIAPIPIWLRKGFVLLLLVLVASLALLVPLAHHWSAIRERLLAMPTTTRRLLGALAAWGQHLDALREPRRLWQVAVLTLLKKAAEVAAVLAVQAAFGVEPSLSTAVLIVAALALSTLVPIAPANLGIYEATVFAVYRFVGTPAETALGLAVVQHLCFLLPSIGTGYALLTLRQLMPRRLRAS
ncbi:MAG: lysylphosphatidylglycerol synthase transmembrane domain-containing protein [Gemmatimonadaceae bacterium]